MSFDGAKLLLPRNNYFANLYVEKHVYGGWCCNYLIFNSLQ